MIHDPLINSRQPLFLDFDGVLCDSVDECYVSSWLAYARMRGGRPTVADAKRETTSAGEESDHRMIFGGYRPYIRRGADYVLLQQCIASGARISSQGDFDRIEEQAGRDRMEQFHELFYAARKEILETDRRYWVTLNKPYEGLVPALRGASAHDGVHIISTKKSEYIAEILESWGVSWPLERLHYSGTEDKGEIIAGVLDGAAEGAVLVDDQIDHLRRLTGGIEGRLASWGYVKPEWLNQDQIPVIALADLIALLGAYTVGADTLGADG
jgi:phosphoglycolate phosphatase-like HAD superfamily hydrolase